MQLVLVGLSHHLAPIEFRERLSFAEHDIPRALASCIERPQIVECAIVSTCNRMEIYAVSNAATATEAYQTLVEHLSAFHNVAADEIGRYLYRFAEHEVASHLMRVASGLDSLVLGEAQILGQVGAALRTAQRASTAHAILTGLFQQAVSGARRVQNETGLGRGAFSIGHAAVDLARSIFGDLANASVLILGAGKMSELTARHLVQSGVNFVVVANRTHAKAVDMANRLGGRAIQYDSFHEELVTADIVISSTAAPHPIIHADNLKGTLRRRRGKPLFLIDIAVPRDIDPDVARLDNVFLYNIDDLQGVIAGEAQGRVSEAARAEAIAADEAAHFLAWYRTREAAPVITELRGRLDFIRLSELDLLRSQLTDLSERDWRKIEAAFRSMSNKFAREPILRLKRATDIAETVQGEETRYDLLTAAREIFGLDSPSGTATTNSDIPDEPSLVCSSPAPTRGIPDEPTFVSSPPITIRGVPDETSFVSSPPITIRGVPDDTSFVSMPVSARETRQ